MRLIYIYHMSQFGTQNVLNHKSCSTSHYTITYLLFKHLYRENITQETVLRQRAENKGLTTWLSWQAEPRCATSTWWGNMNVCTMKYLP